MNINNNSPTPIDSDSAVQMVIGFAAKNLSSSERHVIRLVSKDCKTGVDYHAPLNPIEEKVEQIQKQIAALEDNLIWEILSSEGMNYEFRQLANKRNNETTKQIEALQDQVTKLLNASKAES